MQTDDFRLDAPRNPIETTIARMETHQKAAQVLELLKQPLAGMNLSHRADDGLNVFETERDGVKHRVCYPDELLTQRDPKDLALVVVAILALLRADPASARVIVRSGMFETMLRTATSYPHALPAMP
jgi:hypothetical protein